MTEELHISFGLRVTRLEGLFAAAQQPIGAVIAHPHPLMGGDMRNPVVEILREALSGCGLSTIRFNFRGVGMSDGDFDEGVGEQEDVLAAAEYLESRGIQEIVPAGYSFGAWVCAGVISRKNFAAAILVSPPIALFPFDFESLRGKVGLIICGDHDPFCPLEELRKSADRASCRLVIIPDTDHFMRCREADLFAGIVSFVGELLSKKSSSDDKK